MEYYANPGKLDENDEMAMFSQTTNKSENQKLGEKLAFDLVKKVSFSIQLPKRSVYFTRFDD